MLVLTNRAFISGIDTLPGATVCANRWYLSGIYYIFTATNYSDLFVLTTVSDASNTVLTAYSTNTSFSSVAQYGNTELVAYIGNLLLPTSSQVLNTELVAYLSAITLITITDINTLNSNVFYNSSIALSSSTAVGLNVLVSYLTNFTLRTASLILNSATLTQHENERVGQNVVSNWLLIKGSGPWDFVEQPNKWGYLNNPTWKDDL